MKDAKDLDQQYRDEAERLALLPRADQKTLIAQHRAIASDRKVPKLDRQAASDRADALERHLRRLNRKKSAEKK